MLYKFRKSMNRKFYNWLTDNAKQNLRVSIDENSDFTILTQLCSSDINMYLVALSSFTRFLKPRSVVVVADRLSEAEQDLLRQCVNNIIIIPITTASHPDLPKGGCWERLISIHSLLADTYVVQLDADIICLRYPKDVADLIKNNQSFTLATKMGRNKISMSDASKLVADIESDHVQVLVEKAFADFSNSGSRSYIRGCAGFAGFSKQSANLDGLVEFSREAERSIGKTKWHQWGSEQVASNYVVANSPNSRVLPFEQYPYFEPGVDMDSADLLHFIGDYRYKGWVYVKQSRKVIAECQSK